MTTRYEVSCSTKDISGRNIEYFGGTVNGQRWRVHVSEAIDLIITGKYVFFLRHMDKTLELIVVDVAGEPSIAVAGDVPEPKPLLDLPDCP